MSIGLGACEASGVYVCSASGNGVICDAEPGAPEPETCNLQDDDCDGRVDEGNWSRLWQRIVRWRTTTVMGGSMKGKWKMVEVVE